MPYLPLSLEQTQGMIAKNISTPVYGTTLESRVSRQANGKATGETKSPFSRAFI
jgi:hypothetical protein